LADKTEKILLLEEQQKMLQAKLEGFERLSERLQEELERSLNANEEELITIKAKTNTLLARQAEEAQSVIVSTKGQLGAQVERFERGEMVLRGEICVLQEELSVERSRGEDMQFQLEQVNEFLAIYKDKFEELQSQHQEVQETHAVLSENALRFEQLYREERAKNDALTMQKQSLAGKLARAGEQIDKRLQQDS
jgi:chromosome segregation ATPase